MAKGFVSWEASQAGWESRGGRVTSLRVAPPAGLDASATQAFRESVRSALDPLTAGFVGYPARRLALEGSVGVPSE